MTWVRLDDGFAEHPKVLAAGAQAVTLHVRALCWCSRRMTDGFIPAAALPVLMFDLTETGLPEKLVAAGIWEDRGDGGFWIHDFLDYNPSKRQIMKGRRQAAGRAKTYRTRHARVTPLSPDRSPELPLPPSPPPGSGSRSASPVVNQEEKILTLRPQVNFQVPDSVLDALKKCRILGAVDKLRTPAFWQAMIRAHKGIDYGAEILEAEAFLTTHPGYTRHSQFLGNWLRTAARRAKEA